MNVFDNREYIDNIIFRENSFGSTFKIVFSQQDLDTRTLTEWTNQWDTLYAILLYCRINRVTKINDQQLDL